MVVAIFAGNLIGWVALRLEVYETQSEKSKAKAENNKDEKEEKTLKHKTPDLVGVLGWSVFTINLEIV